MWTLSRVSLGRVCRLGAFLLATSIGCRDSVAAPRVASTMTAISATTQEAIAGQVVGRPPTVLVRDARGEPVTGIAVVFADGVAKPYVTTTLNDGTAYYAWIVSPHVGAGRLTVSAQGLTSVEFVANVRAGPPVRVATTSTAEQIGDAGTPVASAPSVRVTDTYGNGTPDIKVTFALDGDGAASIARAAVNTDADGNASAGSWTLGSVPGDYTVTASISSSSVGSVVFRARVNAPFAVSSIAAGATASCAIARSGGMYCWGRYLSIGLPSATTPYAITNVPALVSLAVGDAFGCGLTSAGSAYCWGTNDSGQLGIGTKSSFEGEPRAVSGGLAFTSLVTGDAFTCGLTTNQLVYCWGNNILGQLGDATSNGRATPAPISTTEHFTAIAAGFQHACAIATTGTTYCWGLNSSGQLGAQSADICHIDVPDYYGYGTTSVEVGCAMKPIAAKDTPVGLTALAASNGTCGLLDGGQAYCWGYAGTGSIPNTGRFTSLAAGNGVVCGITTAQSIACWSYADPHVPPSSYAPVPAIAAAQRIVSGHQHWCAIDGAGIAFCWGDNLDGQLGNGTRAPSATPLAVAAP
jgi:alpha-tubulin suppressor-like RCC1 family protein